MIQKIWSHIASVCTIPKEYIQRFKTMIYHFIWGGKKDRIKRIDLCKDYSKGGFKMIDIYQLKLSVFVLKMRKSGPNFSKKLSGIICQLLMIGVDVVNL
jgi:hypothetical protein